MQKAFVNNKTFYFSTLKLPSMTIGQIRAYNYRRSMANLGFRLSLPQSIIIYVRTGVKLKTFFIFFVEPSSTATKFDYALIDVEFMLMSASIGISARLAIKSFYMREPY